MLTHLPPYVTDAQAEDIIREVESMASRMAARGHKRSAEKLKIAVDALKRELAQRRSLTGGSGIR